MVYAGLAAVGFVAMGAVGLAVGLFLWGDGSLSSLPQNLQMAAIFSLEAILIIPAWRWGPGKYGGGFASLGLRRFPPARSGLLCLLGLAAVLVIDGAWEVVRKWLGVPGQPNYLPMFGGGWQGLAVALLLGGLVAPLAEEIFFRGYLYVGLRERWGRGWGMAISACLFSFVHFIPGVLPPIFLMGLLFSLIYDLTDSLWPCIALHGAINSLAFVAAYLAERFPQIVPGA